MIHHQTVALMTSAIADPQVFYSDILSQEKLTNKKQTTLLVVRKGKSESTMRLVGRLRSVAATVRVNI